MGLGKGFGQGLFDKDSVLTSKAEGEKMDVKEAFETLFGFNLADFDDVYNNSCMVRMFETLEEARKVKKACEKMKEVFEWKEEFSIYKYSNRWYAVEDSNQFEPHGDIKKIE